MEFDISNENVRRMLSGQMYVSSEPAICEVQDECLACMEEFNGTKKTENKKRAELISKMFAEAGEGCYIEAPFYANWGGRHVHLGRNVYMNFSVTLVDDGDIYIGDNCLIGPNVTIATACHPVSPELRDRACQYNLEVHIGHSVWIGAGAIILPGVSVGDNSIIGAGSVVTKDIPSGVIAVGNPCRVLREINDHDKEYYYKDRKIDI